VGDRKDMAVVGLPCEVDALACLNDEVLVRVEDGLLDGGRVNEVADFRHTWVDHGHQVRHNEVVEEDMNSLMAEDHDAGVAHTMDRNV